MAKPEPIRDTLEALSLEVLPHAAYSSNLTPFDYHLFESMGYALASYEDVKKRLNK